MKILMSFQCKVTLDISIIYALRIKISANKDIWLRF